MADITFWQQDRDLYAVTFDYDAELVEMVNAVPCNQRRGVAEKKQWQVHVNSARELARSIRELGHTVIGIDPTGMVYLWNTHGGQPRPTTEPEMSAQSVDDSVISLRRRKENPK